MLPEALLDVVATTFDEEGLPVPGLEDVDAAVESVLEEREEEAEDDDGTPPEPPGPDTEVERLPDSMYTPEK